MKREAKPRRTFIKTGAATAAGMTVTALAAPNIHLQTSRIKFGVIGLNHGHINGQVKAVLRGGGELVSFFAKEPDLVAKFQKDFPQAKLARSEDEVLNDSSLQLIVSASIPNERAALGVRVMQHGKDFMVDKPGVTSLEQLAVVRRVQVQTKRIFSILFSERLENPATVKACEMVKAGVIGKVVQTVSLGPHQERPETRPPWFYDPKIDGGILANYASHQFDQFLYFTGSTSAEVVAAQLRNVNHPKHPKFEDFGDALLHGNGGTGYLRVDWFTPNGLGTWGDGRLTVLGTDGFLEIRKNVDIGGRKGGNHLFLVNQKETRYFDCSKEPLPYGEQLVNDVLHRTETAMPQAHCFLAMELALKAQKMARFVA